MVLMRHPSELRTAHEGRLDWNWVGSTAPLLFLDVEARSDEAARRLSGKAESGASFGPKKIIAASCLSRFAEASGTKWELRNYHCAKMPEADLLSNVHAQVQRLAATGGVLITYNGVQHDLPLLRDRQSRWWQFEDAAILDYAEGRHPHLDLLNARREGGRRPGSLAEACASLGICLLGPNTLQGKSLIPREVEKADLDVIGTAALFFYVVGSRGRRTDTTRDGLVSLGAFLRQVAPHSPHLRTLSRNPQFGPDCRAWGGAACTPSRRRQERAALLC
jgi:hypothetical protein